MITVTFPSPITINKAYATAKNGRRVLTKAARNYKKQVGYLARAAANGATFDPAALYTLELILYFPADGHRRDGDNFIKLAQDAVCAALHIDDSRITRQEIEKRISYTGESWAELTLRYKD